MKNCGPPERVRSINWFGLVPKKGQTMNLKKPFFLVWNPQGCAPQRQHEDLSSAQVEATRLARANRGQRFIVLRPVEEVVLDEVQRSYYEQEHDETPF